MGGGALLPVGGKAAEQETGIAVVEGTNPASQVREAIRLLGGIERFIRRGDRVVLLPNPQGIGRGVTTNPDIVAETVRLCLSAGASSVSVASCHGKDRWLGTGIIESVEASGGRMKYPDSKRDWVTIRVPKPRARKEVTVIRDALEADRLINMPIFKQHSYTRVTGCIKNLMGTNDDNWGFHKGDTYLHQAIVDLASIFSPALCLVDATTILTERGPFGPGRVIHPNRVYAGKDMVALDALCCDLLNVKPHQVLYIQLAHESGLGRMNPKTDTVKRLRI
ncbi:MAG: DUF362 domain-containing protein [Desulfobacterota bacterium]|nr:DUF362 domain-containing protein [Thermodesulfobacteriota bacterium]